MSAYTLESLAAFIASVVCGFYALFRGFDVDRSANGAHSRSPQISVGAPIFMYIVPGDSCRAPLYMSETLLSLLVISMIGEDLLKLTLDELDKLISAKTVMGEKIEVDNKIIIPVAGFGFGFGAGGGSGKGDEESGGGVGAGGGVTPVAVIILHKDVKGHEGVQVLSLKKSSPVAEVIETIGETVLPQVMDAVKSQGKAKQEEKKPATGKTGTEE